MKIEVGGFYRTVGGEKIGPMREYSGDDEYLGQPDDERRLWHVATGGRHNRHHPQDDLVAVWQDELKVGDRVRSKPVPSAGIGTVISIDPLKVDYKDTWFRVCGESPETIELISSAPPSAQPTTTPAIVAVIIDGKAAPNKKPKLHASVAAAEQEADRLAARHPGQQFDVFARVSGRVADVTLKAVA